MKKVKVYFNLHKKLFSVVSLEGEDKGLVIDHAREIDLVDCKLVVQPGGNKRVRKEMKKNVHAYIAGFLAAGEDMERAKKDCMKSTVTYNPYRHKSFMMFWDYGLAGTFAECFPIVQAKACSFNLSPTGKPEVFAFGGQ